MKKLVVAGFSLLAVGLLVLGSQTSVVGYQTEGNGSVEKPVQVIVNENKADGSTKTTMVTLSSIQYLQLRQELKTAQDCNKRLAIYQKYGLIPKNVTMEKLRSGMEQREKQLGINSEQVSLSHQKIILGIKCQVDAGGEFVVFPLRKMIFEFFYFIKNPYNYYPGYKSYNLFIWIMSTSVIVNEGDVHSYGDVQLFGFVGYNCFYMAWYTPTYESFGYCALCLGEKPIDT